MPVPGSLKCSTQALHASTLEEKSGREILDNDGIDTKPEKSNTVPFQGNNCRSFPYRRTATMGAAAAASVQERGNMTRNDDVEQSLKTQCQAE